MNLGTQILVRNALSNIEQGKYEEAFTLLDRALQSLPNDSEILRLMSVVAAHQSDFQKALVLIEQSISAMPENGLAHSNRANILRELGRYEDALGSYENAIRLEPDYAEAYNNKANVLQDLKRYEESLSWYDKAISIDPNYAVAYCNKGNAFEWLGRHDEAMDCFNKATQINPEHIDAYWQKAMNQLSGGNYELGFQNYEARWSKSDPVAFQYGHLPRLVSIQDLENTNILVWSEQGLGDVIQFCRYIKLLADKGCKITFIVPQQLEPLMRDSLHYFCTIKKNTEELTENFDFHTPLMSLPLLFGTTTDTVPNTIPYLFSNASQQKKFRELITPSSNLKVGVIWSGSNRLIHDYGYAEIQRRNLTLDLIASLQDVKGIDFYSLQKGDPAESELLGRKELVWPSIIPLGSKIEDFADTAALMECLDLIISVDTSTAHLAGALGKPVWIMNRYDSCWRWLRGRRHSPWYPTATIYQQSQPGNWIDVVAEIQADLAILAKKVTDSKFTDIRDSND